MIHLVGVDEAGYGPNLGPLVVAATAWSIPACDLAVDLYESLASAIAKSPTPRDPPRIAVADSKALYKSGGGLRLLERGVLAALRMLGRQPGDWNELLAAATADPHGQDATTPWHSADESLPLAADAAEVAAAADQWNSACAASGVQLLAVRARVVQPAEFNDLVAQFGNKGAVLSHLSLQLARAVVDEMLGETTDQPPSPCFLTFDKHGGRNRYAALLQDCFHENWIEVLCESRAASRYRWHRRGRMLEAQFRVGGEEELPAALASMTAKYLRELSMRQFNRFWQSHVPHLAPTAGYPIDARRFQAEIADAQRRLRIAGDDLWRSR